MPLPVRAASTVERSLAGHSSQRGAAAPTVAPGCEAAGPAAVLDPLPPVAGIAAFEVLAATGGVVVETPAPRVVALLESGEAAVVAEPVVTARLLPAMPNRGDDIEPPGNAVVVVVDPVVAAAVVGEAVRLVAGEPMVWASAAGTTQHRQSGAGSRADRRRKLDITRAFARAVTVQTAYLRRRSRLRRSFPQ
ncbi:MAG TPA: hypothetical protein VLV85_04575 [Stellaceae bacterium]|nr:hypothetical protein [Stellaceae bacterium]